MQIYLVVLFAVSCSARAGLFSNDFLVDPGSVDTGLYHPGLELAFNMNSDGDESVLGLSADGSRLESPFEGFDLESSSAPVTNALPGDPANFDMLADTSVGCSRRNSQKLRRGQTLFCPKNQDSTTTEEDPEGPPSPVKPKTPERKALPNIHTLKDPCPATTEELDAGEKKVAVCCENVIREYDGSYSVYECRECRIYAPPAIMSFFGVSLLPANFCP